MKVKEFIIPIIMLSITILIMGTLLFKSCTSNSGLKTGYKGGMHSMDVVMEIINES